MPDPTTSNILLAIPTRGSDSGTWDTPVNGDFTALDGIIGGQTAISLSNVSPITLTMPATGTVSASAGPNQSQNAVVKLTGTLTSNIAIVVQMPRKYVFDNQCTVGNFLIAVVANAVPGTSFLGLPPGEKTEVWFDGSAVDYVGMGRVGSFLDLCVATTPAWMTSTANSKLPYLLCDGATYSTANYTALGNMLGSTFGGNGITTFGVPDTQSRLRLSLATSGVGRVTNAISGVDGATIAATGGDQRLQTHTHGVTDPGHRHSVSGAQDGTGGAFLSILSNSNSGTLNSSIGTSTTGITINNTGTGSSQNMPPAIVFGLTFIKT